VLRLPAEPSVTVAGRTDAGVHARGQVAHVDVPEAVDLEDVTRRLAGILPPDVRVFTATVAPPGFDARFSALWRRYAYRVSDAATGVDPLRRHEVLDHRRPLDVVAMDAAAALVEGEHDFAAYCRRRPEATTRRRLLRCYWQRAEGGLAVATVMADAFCHGMVRSLVGAFLVVGEGRRAIEWPAQVLERGIRDAAVQVVAPRGLTLEEVRYPPDRALAARADETRRRRTS
jgi:tRNA pseudouridine38-40 synthase